MPATIEILGINEVLERLRIMQWSLSQSPRKIVQEVAKIAKEALQQEAPVRTGALRRGIRYRTFAPSSSYEAFARFTSDADYTPFVIHGTAPHFIRPVNAKALYWPGSAHPVAFVRHPGTRPDDFVERAMREVERAAERLLEVTGQDIVDGRRVAA